MRYLFDGRAIGMDVERHLGRLRRANVRRAFQASASLKVNPR